MRSLDRFEPLGYALLRAAYAGIVLTHGLPKLLRIPHGSIADPLMATTAMIQRMGLPFAFEAALAVTALETVGALLLALGLFTRPIAAVFVAEMTGISIAMGPTWPWTDKGIEYPMMLAALAAYFVLRGPGAWALRRPIDRAIGPSAS
jgi:putative oxidoreductase